LQTLKPYTTFLPVENQQMRSTGRLRLSGKKPAETVSRRAIARGWEGFLRLGASVKHGWESATAALDRFGSAAAGDPVYNTGDGLGRLLRTLYLCDYLSNPCFAWESSISSTRARRCTACSAPSTTA
jgi:TnpA family transposase